MEITKSLIFKNFFGQYFNIRKHGQFMTMLTLLKSNEIKVAVAADILSLVKSTPVK
jgi:hypothetical protein